MICVIANMLGKKMNIAAINDNEELLISQKITCHEMALKHFFDDLGKPIQAVVEVRYSNPEKRNHFTHNPI